MTWEVDLMLLKNNIIFMTMVMNRIKLPSTKLIVQVTILIIPKIKSIYGLEKTDLCAPKFNN